MKTSFDDIFINNYPTLDLHGETKDSSRVLIKEFIEDNYNLKNNKVLIIHGIGSGILKKEVEKDLKLNKLVNDFHINHFNSGCTVVYIKER